ncbi:MAG: diguanylate cyclase [Paracoccaceae bacterium]
MHGTILVIDGVATNRIMLKVLLTAACYSVVQANTLAGLDAILDRIRPDLIVTATKLPDGTVTDLIKILNRSATHRTIPILATAAQNDRSSRLNALEAGIDDVLHQPLYDTILQARIRSLIRRRTTDEELNQDSVAASAFGFAEASAPFDAGANARIALITPNAATAAVWRGLLQDRIPYKMRPHPLNDITSLMSLPPPDAVVVGFNAADRGAAFNLISDLKARSTTRNAAIIAIPDPASSTLAAEALDRGADDALQFGFCVSELSLRLRRQLRLKARSDRYRKTMRNGIEAATTDYLTKLHNRRYLRYGVEQMIRLTSARNQNFALLIADLDHFKSVNDTYGHPAGDSVLVQTAARLKKIAGPHDIAARIGGEEFVIALSNTDCQTAHRTAEQLRQAIGSKPFHLPEHACTINITASIGVVMGAGRLSRDHHAPIDTLLFEADKALYAAKHAGRNQVHMAGLPA